MNGSFNNYYPTNRSYTTYPAMNSSIYNNTSGDRFIAGGFVAPFLLGGLAGAALAPAFRPQPMWWGPYPAYPPYCCW